MKIAIDAMGGDHAPEVIVQGAIQAAQSWPDIDIILVGDQEHIEHDLTDAPANISIHHATEVIAADDEPVRAVRRKKDASMVVAGRLVHDRQADAMISAGNTGALMATALLVIGRIKGIERPALAPILPTLDGTGVLALDLGANMDADAKHLLQYAIMGSIYRHKIHGMAKPRVGLLNVGTEAEKGNDLTKRTEALLEKSNVHFIGNVEARDVFHSNCDVLICDGFVGNIMLKSMEGTADAIFTSLRNEVSQSTFAKLGAAVLKPTFRKLKKRLDYTEYGGAPMLGVKGVCIKSHGSSDAYAIKNAVKQAITSVQNELVEAIASEFNKKQSGVWR